MPGIGKGFHSLLSKFRTTERANLTILKAFKPSCSSKETYFKVVIYLSQYNVSWIAVDKGSIQGI